MDFQSLYKTYSEKYLQSKNLLEEIHKYYKEIYQYAKELWLKENKPLNLKEYQDIRGINLWTHYDRLPPITEDLNKDIPFTTYRVEDIYYDLCSREKFNELLEGKLWDDTFSITQTLTDDFQNIVPVCVIKLLFPNYEDTEEYYIISQQLKFYEW